MTGGMIRRSPKRLDSGSTWKQWLRSKYRCLENDEEPPYTVQEAKRTLQCHISDKTAHLFNAIEGSLTENIEKNSPFLGREAQYSKECQMSRLPPYLAVQA